MSNTLFSQSYLESGLKETDEYQQVSPQQLSHLGQDLRAPYQAFLSAYESSNEAQIEDALIRPVLNALGWSYLPQQPIPVSGKTPDYTLFADDADRAAFTAGGDVSVYPLAPAEAKARDINLDRRAGALSPSAQIQDYLRAFWQSTNGRVKWGILTNGDTWRLYRATGPGPDGKFHRTQDTWLELNLSEIVSDVGKEPRRLFLLFFHRDAFRIGDDGYCFLDRALAQATDYVQNVVDTLTDAAFNDVYPQLISAFFHAAPDATPDDIQEASLTLLYRLLFLMYAEDRRLLPTEHPAYSTISLRGLRTEIRSRMESGPVVFLNTYTYWPRLQELFTRIDSGEPAAALPPYNGGLFNRQTPRLLARVQLPDASVAAIVHSLGAAARDTDEKVLVNFRDLSVTQLGTLYEQLLEQRPVIRNGQVSTQLQPYARKDSGSYYTPPELVNLIIEQTLTPLVRERAERFQQLAHSLASDTRDFAARRRELAASDPAEAVLQLKALDPAMGSGHFLVAALDYLTGEVDRLAGLGAEIAAWLPDDDPYVSPLETRIANIRNDIQRQARENGWQLNPESLTDRAIIRRMVLKRCIYGVDLNPLTVELAKMSLWLHSFTVGAPLSFLDHHLRCGNSLVGGWLQQTADDIRTAGGLFAGSVISGLTAAASEIQTIEQLNDTDLAEVKESAALFHGMEQTVQPLRNMLNFFTGLRWIAAGNGSRPLSLQQPRQLRRQIGDDHAAAVQWWLLQDRHTQLRLLQYGPDAISDEQREAPDFDFAGLARFITLWRAVQELAEARRIFHWELAFPGVFTNWTPRRGGFDAVIGNPPWERIKLQEVEWFAPQSRRPAIASAAPASRRRAMIAQLQAQGDPLHDEYTDALNAADAMLQYGRISGDYPLLGGGDANLYRLFMERAAALTQSGGVTALLTPSGIYGDQSAAKFFSDLTANRRLLALYDFENRRGPDSGQFFPDVDSRFKFCALVIGGSERTSNEVPAGFLLHDPPDKVPPERLITMQASDFALVNPKTATAPIFLTKRDADIVLNIYRNHPVFETENRNFKNLTAVVRHVRQSDMTNDSVNFRESTRLERDGWYPVSLNRYRRGSGEMLPLYQARMIYHFDHRYNSVILNTTNVSNPYTNEPVTDVQHGNPGFFAKPQYWIDSELVRTKFADITPFAVGFRLITNATNERTLIATIVPWAGYGNSLPILVCDSEDAADAFTDSSPLWSANFSSFAMDFIARRKLQGTNMNWYILQQLPVITRAAYNRPIGNTTAADLIRDHVLKLCYTAHDLQPFAQSQLPLLPAALLQSASPQPSTQQASQPTPTGQHNANLQPISTWEHDGNPYPWDTTVRRHLRARLDALYFILYGLNRNDAAYILDTFPITRRNDERNHGRYLTKDLILGYMNALTAGDTTTTLSI